MILPRSERYVSIPNGFLPLIGDATVNITCTPGPCTTPDRTNGPSFNCTAYFFSSGRDVSKSIQYCATAVSQVVQSTSSSKTSAISKFFASFGDGVEFFLTFVAYLLAFLTVMAGLILFLSLLVVIAGKLGVGSWCSKTETPADTTTNAPSAGEDNTAGGAAIEMTASPAQDADRVTEDMDESSMENASEATDDATQWDDSESAQLIVAKDAE